MPSRYAWSLVVLCVAALGQLWFTCVLLLGRQVETLLLGSVIACVFWFWCFWAYFLGKRYAGLALTGFCLIVTLALSGVCLLDMLDESGTRLLVR